MDITYCNTKCAIGISARKAFLDENDSVFEAAADFNYFIEDCYESCPHKEVHIKQKETTE